MINTILHYLAPVWFNLITFIVACIIVLVVLYAFILLLTNITTKIYEFISRKNKDLTEKAKVNIYLTFIIILGIFLWYIAGIACCVIFKVDGWH